MSLGYQLLCLKFTCTCICMLVILDSYAYNRVHILKSFLKPTTVVSIWNLWVSVGVFPMPAQHFITVFLFSNDGTDFIDSNIAFSAILILWTVQILQIWCKNHLNIRKSVRNSKGLLKVINNTFHHNFTLLRVTVRILITKSYL